MKPKTLEILILSLSKMPGISKKQAERIALSMITQKKEEALDISISIKSALSNIKKCSQCGHLTDEDICDICSDNTRERKLVVVESSLDIFKFEKSNIIRPYYHVLGGLIDVSKDIDFENLNINTLKERSKKFKEIILALSPNLEGIVTSNYIKQLLGENKVTQLAQGIPLGAAMEYVDEITLKTAIENRKEVK